MDRRDVTAPSNRRRLAGRLLWLALTALLAWQVLLPPSLGWRTRFVLAEGSSMRPALNRDDLAVVRVMPPSSYRVGDVALYRSRQLDRLVLHRIVRIGTDGRVRLRGDSNDFVDSERPHRTDLAGRMAFRIPAAGKVPGVGSPLLPAVALLLGALLVGSAFAAPRPRPQQSAQGGGWREHAAPGLAGQHEHAASGLTGRRWHVAAAVAAIVAGASGGLALLQRAATMPTAAVTTRASTPRYEHQGTFGYAARERSSAIAPDGRVGTGDAVFIDTAGRLEATFDYRVDGPKADTVEGTATLDMVVDDQNGWTLRRRLASSMVAEGEASLRAQVDLRALRRRLLRFERASSSTPLAYRVVLEPSVEISDTAPKPIAGTTFAPELPLVFDTRRLRPELLTGGDARTQYTPAKTISAGRQATGRGGQPHRRTLTPSVLRALALVAMLAGLFGAGAIMSASGQRRHRDEDNTTWPHAVASPPSAMPTPASADDHETPSLYPAPVPDVHEPPAPPPHPAATAAIREVPTLADYAAPTWAFADQVDQILERAGVLSVGTATFSLDETPLVLCKDANELVNAATFWKRPVVRQRAPGINRWFVRTPVACYCLDGADHYHSALSRTPDEATPWALGDLPAHGSGRRAA